MHINYISDSIKENFGIKDNNEPKVGIGYTKVKSWEINDKKIDLYLDNKEFQVYITENDGRQIRIPEIMDCFQAIIGINKKVKEMDLKKIDAFFKDTYVKIHPFGKYYKVLISQRGKGGMYKVELPDEIEGEHPQVINNEIDVANSKDVQIQIRGDIDLSSVYQNELVNIQKDREEYLSKINEIWDKMVKQDKNFKNTVYEMMSDIWKQDCSISEKKENIATAKEIIAMIKEAENEKPQESLFETLEKITTCQERASKTFSEKNIKLVNSALKTRQEAIQQVIDYQNKINEVELKL